MTDLISLLIPLATSQQLVLWAADCAEHVLPIWEAAYPDDKRPHEAVAAARRGDAARAADAASAAYAAASAAARDAARAAYAARAAKNEETERAWQTDRLLTYLMPDSSADQRWALCCAARLGADPVTLVSQP